MNIGASHFNGERLKEAREARCLTITALAESLDISRQSITAYEKGTQSPRLDILDKIADRLNVPSRFFLRPNIDTINKNIVFYRSLASTTNLERSRSEKRLMWLKEMVQYLEGFIKFLDVNFPNINLSDEEISNLRDEEIENIANKCREFWNIGLGAISNIARLLENNGAIISRGEIETDAVDAFSEWSQNDRPYLILGNDKKCGVRSRFDLAHELGHLVLHKNLSKLNKNNLKIIEHQANYFAGAFLMPAVTFISDFLYPSLDTFVALKQKWRTSIQAMIVRTSNLGLITKKTEERLWINLARRGWRKKEPLDDVIPHEQPMFLRRSIDLLISNNIQTKADLKINLPYAQKDIEVLLNLDIDQLNKESIEPNHLKPGVKIFNIHSRN
ncbi:MAG: XRE family transcriptional regulator [Melioribacteraceae bacterium]